MVLRILKKLLDRESSLVEKVLESFQEYNNLGLVIG